MKTILALLALISFSLFAAEAPVVRTVTLPSGPHPKAEIIRVEPANGVVLFAYLNASGRRVDSGNSVAKFTPPTPIPPAQPGAAPTYPVVSDVTLAAAIVASQ